MAGISNAEHLRRWLFGCEAIDAAKRFGVDWLGDGAAEYALLTAPSPLAWTENIVGERRLKDRQAQRFLLVLQAYRGADAARNLENLARCQAVADWIVARNAARDFPEWEGGEVTGVTPAQIGAQSAQSDGGGRYQVEIVVHYRVG